MKTPVPFANWFFNFAWVSIWDNKDDLSQFLQVIGKLSNTPSLVLSYHVCIRWYSMSKNQNIVVKFYYYNIMKTPVPFTYWFFNLVKVSIQDNKDDSSQFLHIIEHLSITLSLVLLYHICIRWYSMNKDQSIVVKFYYHSIMKIQCHLHIGSLILYRFLYEIMKITVHNSCQLLGVL